MANEAKKNEKISYDVLGNIIGLDIPKYNVITRDDDLTVIKAKRKAQQEQWGKEN